MQELIRTCPQLFVPRWHSPVYGMYSFVDGAFTVVIILASRTSRPEAFE